MIKIRYTNRRRLMISKSTNFGSLHYNKQSPGKNLGWQNFLFKFSASSPSAARSFKKNFLVLIFCLNKFQNRLMRSKKCHFNLTSTFAMWLDAFSVSKILIKNFLKSSNRHVFEFHCNNTTIGIPTATKLSKTSE